MYHMYDLHVHVFQARPVTTLHQESEWEMIHEFDSALVSDSELITTANVGWVLISTWPP